MVFKKLSFILPKILQVHITMLNEHPHLVLNNRNSWLVIYKDKKYWLKQIVLIELKGNFRKEAIIVYGLFGKVTLSLADMQMYQQLSLPAFNPKIKQPKYFNSIEKPAIKSPTIQFRIQPISICLYNSVLNIIAKKLNIVLKPFIQTPNQTA